MEELFIETKNGNVKIEDEIIQKYNLKKGYFTPFTHERIVGKNGDFRREDIPLDKGSLNQVDDEIEEMENGLMLSQSEMIDIAQGVDSET